MSRSFVIYSKTNRPKKPLLPPAMTGEYVDYEVHQEIKKYSNDPKDFEIIDIIEEKKVNIDKFINSFKNDVGVDAVLKKIALTGDMQLLNQTEGIHMDTTIIPDDPEEALKLSRSAEEAFAALDPELTEGLTMEEFVRNLTAEKLDKYISKKVNEKLGKEKADDESGK